MAEAKRVLVFSTAYLPLVGGAELAVHELAKRLPEFKFEVVTARLRPDLPAQETVGAVTVHRVGRGRRSDKFLLPIIGRPLVRQLMAKQPAAIFWSIMASQASILAAWAKRRYPQIPLVLTLQEGDTEDHLKRYVGGSSFLYRWLVRPWHLRVFERANHITAISRDLLNRARSHRRTVPLTLIPNGVDLDHFRWRSLVELPKKEIKTIITTSRLVEKNGLFDLIAALSFLPPNVELKIFGTGPDESRLREWAEERGVMGRVHFAGQADHHRIALELARADVFVRPSLSEGLGNSFLEAMAVGVPIIGTPVGGIPDFLRPGETGWSCRVHDPESVARAVAFVLAPENHDQVQAVAQAARKLVEERFDWTVLARSLSLVFKSL